MEVQKKEMLNLEIFLAQIKILEILFNTDLSKDAVLIYYKTLSSWGVTDRNIEQIIGEVIKKSHRFPALAAFWTAKTEAGEWK